MILKDNIELPHKTKSKNYMLLFVLAFIFAILAYALTVGIYKHFQKNKINDFYTQEHQISQSSSLVNYPIPQIKNIPENKPVRILVLEGGGIHGIISTQLLNFIEKNSGKPISDLFDIITGTSIGALQSVVLTVPDKNNRPKYSAEDLLTIFLYRSPEILGTTSMDWILTGFGLISPIINIYSYTDVLKQYIGNTQLSQLTTNVLLTGYNIPQRQIMFLKSRRTKNDNPPNFLAYQVTAGVTAIPGLMPPQKITSISGNKEQYLIADPARIINNPLLAAYLYADNLYPKNEKILVFLGMGLDEKSRKKDIPDYYEGLLGGITQYYDMGWSNDKLFKYYFTELGSFNSPGVPNTDLYFIDEVLEEHIGNSMDITKENLWALQAAGNSIIKKQRKQLMTLIGKLKR